VERLDQRLGRVWALSRHVGDSVSWAATLVPGWAKSAEHVDVLSWIRALDARLGGK
jgi:hypothetical protein